MSVLSMNFDAVLSAFKSPHVITVYDTVGEYVAGEWVEGELVPRPNPLNAIVLAMKTADLDFLTQGDSSSSGISLTTKEILYWVDANLPGDGQERRQSYVDYQGFRYRVSGEGLMMGNTNTHIYHALRFLL